MLRDACVIGLCAVLAHLFLVVVISQATTSPAHQFAAPPPRPKRAETARARDDAPADDGVLQRIESKLSIVELRLDTMDVQLRRLLAILSPDDDEAAALVPRGRAAGSLVASS